MSEPSHQPKSPSASLKLNFREDTMTTVSRVSLKRMANELGFNETQTVLYALARLRDQLGENRSEFEPLTEEHHRAIAQAEPKGRGRVIDSIL